VVARQLEETDNMGRGNGQCCSTLGDGRGEHLRARGYTQPVAK
jgi:hypothetical protein